MGLQGGERAYISIRVDALEGELLNDEGGGTGEVEFDHVSESADHAVNEPRRGRIAL